MYIIGGNCAWFGYMVESFKLASINLLSKLVFAFVWENRVVVQAKTVPLVFELLESGPIPLLLKQKT